MDKSKLERGFTLIELIVVVSIITLLITFAVPSYLDALERSKLDKVKADVTILQNAVLMYYFDESEYPTDLETLVTKKYIKKVPSSPWKGISYSYDGEIVSLVKDGETVYADGYEK